MIFGSTSFLAESGYSKQILDRASKLGIEITNIYENAEGFHFTGGAESLSQIKMIFDELGCDHKIESERGFFVRLKQVLSKKGLLLGILVSAVIIKLLSNTVFQIEISGCTDTNQQVILDILADEGIAPGKSIKDIDLTVTERTVKSKADNIAWVGISVDGNRLVIDTVEYTPKPEFTVHRLPSNIVACENGFIEDIELFDGQLLKPIGSGVSKGDIIISGKVITDKISYIDGKEEHDISTRYTRAIGNIYGTFERTVSFSQPYTEQVRCLSDETEKAYSIEILDVTIPIFSLNGNYTVTESKKHTPSLFGLDLPVSFSISEAKSYSYAETNYTKEQAYKAAVKKSEIYEANFLSDHEIIDREVTREADDNGVTITVKYKLYGSIGKEVDFFIKK
ncbi:MAG: sporulation protein YqfD [Ruminococcus sp.]|nr:sporulation protein YqfD [Ruminococcus sp.]